MREIEAKGAYSLADESGLTLMGFLAFLDLPKDSVADAIRALNDNGVAVKILTGDNDTVTRNVCRQVGIQVDKWLTGPKIEAMSYEQFRNDVVPYLPTTVGLAIDSEAFETMRVDVGVAVERWLQSAASLWAES